MRKRRPRVRNLHSPSLAEPGWHPGGVVRGGARTQPYLPSPPDFLAHPGPPLCFQDWEGKHKPSLWAWHRVNAQYLRAVIRFSFLADHFDFSVPQFLHLENGSVETPYQAPSRAHFVLT